MRSATSAIESQSRTQRCTVPCRALCPRACKPCSERLTTISNGATAADECVCERGLFDTGDACADCLPIAKRMPRPADEPKNAPGPSCDSDYFSGAPRVEPCNVTGDGWGGKPPCTNYCGRLKTVCPITRNDDEANEK